MLRIALANLRFPSTPDESVALACHAVAEAARCGARIVAFPESFIPGYGVAMPDAPFLERAWSTIANAAATSHITAILGTNRVVDGRTRISALVIDEQGAFAGFQDKVQLDPDEDAAYAPGGERKLFTVDGVTFGIAICHEAWRYPETVRWAARRGAQLVFHPQFHPATNDAFRATTYADAANTFHEAAARCRAAENTIWFATINYAGAGSRTTSALIDPDGNVAAWQPYGVEGLLIADIDPAAATRLLAMRCRTTA